MIAICRYVVDFDESCRNNSRNLELENGDKKETSVTVTLRLKITDAYGKISSIFVNEEVL